MRDHVVKKEADQGRRQLLEGLLLAGFAASGCAATAGTGRSGSTATADNSLLWAVAWKQTSAEFFALCHQAYNLAQLRVDAALAGRDKNDKPLAVITDMDDTIMHAGSYWGYLINQGKDFFDDEIWDAWLPENKITAAPGASQFLKHCERNSVEVFYVTNRDQGPRTYEYAMGQLKHLNYPYADDAHLYVYRDTSDKSPAREEIRQRYEIAVILGDNLNDYKRDYYVTDVEERLRLMQRDQSEFGKEFVLLPNPTDGHWVRAIFGDSEPAPSAENRRILKEAATYRAWGEDAALD